MTKELTPREISVLKQIAEGKANKIAARELGIAPETVKSSLKFIRLKLGLRSRAELAVFASRSGLV